MGLSKHHIPPQALRDMEAALKRGSVIGGFGFVGEAESGDAGIKKADDARSDIGLVTIHEIAAHDDDKHTI